MIKFKNWAKYQHRPGKKVIENTSWLRLENRIAFHDIWSHLNDSEFRFYIFMLCQASLNKNSGKVLENIDVLARMSGVEKKFIKTCISKLLELGIISNECGNRAADMQRECGTTDRQTDTTNKQEYILAAQQQPSDSSFETKKWEPIEELEQIYQLYPKRENTNKKRGMQNLLAKVKTPEQLAEFEQAVRNYADYCKQKKIEPVFVKQFSTFTNNYEEWITVEKIVTKTTLQRWQEKGDDDET